MEGETYNLLDKAWKSTCRALLGGEVGSMRDFERYLSKHLEDSGSTVSSISGKPVALSVQNFCKGARFISNDEREKYQGHLRGAKLSINEVKDIDSVLSALSEKLCYAGNIITGNSHCVEGSDMVSNSSFVLNSSEIYDSKYVAYSDAMRYGEYVFGSNWIGETKFAIKTYETFKVARCMEAMSIGNSSDCFYVARINGCTNCMFSFNQKNRSQLIGNLEFPREEYSKLKGKLIAEIHETLRAKKSAPTIVDIISGNDG